MIKIPTFLRGFEKDQSLMKEVASEWYLVREKGCLTYPSHFKMNRRYSHMSSAQPCDLQRDHYTHFRSEKTEALRNQYKQVVYGPGISSSQDWA